MDDSRYLAALEAAHFIAALFGRSDPETLARILFPILEAIRQAEAAG